MTDAEERRNTTVPADHTEDPTESDSPPPQATPANVHDVIGRRGYDESEDETKTETEEH